MVSKNLRVALLVETASSYGRTILSGVSKYQQTRARWSTFLDESELRASPPQWLFQQSWDGIICRATTPELAIEFKQREIPAVDLNDIFENPGLPRIRTNMQSVGRFAAQHLYERGFRHFAYCGFKGETWSSQRLNGFRQWLGDHSLDCSVYESAWRGSDAPNWTVDQDRIANWLSGMPKPLGLMACNDIRGQHVLNACRSLEIYVPEQLAVVGVDNDELLCGFCCPPLSSIQPNPFRIGFEAAELLDSLMRGGEHRCEDRLIDPLGVITRQSSDALGIKDDIVVAAIAFIRETACHGATVADIVKHIGISRSQLERRFRVCLGHSPQHEIHVTKLRRIKELLRTSDLSLAQIAYLTGFEHTEYMTVVFKRLTGIPPSKYREDSDLPPEPHPFG